MILINLLPHREIARKRRKDRFNLGLVFSVLAGALLAVLVFTWFEAQISDQQGTNQMLKTEIAKFDAQIKDIAGLEAEIAALLARQQAVENLQADRNMPVHLDHQPQLGQLIVPVRLELRLAVIGLKLH